MSVELVTHAPNLKWGTDPLSGSSRLTTAGQLVAYCNAIRALRTPSKPFG